MESHKLRISILNIKSVVKIAMAEVIGILNYIHIYVHWLLTFRPKFWEYHQIFLMLSDSLRTQWTQTTESWIARPVSYPLNHEVLLKYQYSFCSPLYHLGWQHHLHHPTYAPPCVFSTPCSFHLMLKYVADSKKATFRLPSNITRIHFQGPVL